MSEIRRFEIALKIAPWAILLVWALCIAVVYFSPEPKAEVAETAKWNKTLTIPSGTEFMGAYCGDMPCIVYWDTVDKAFVLGMADGGSIRIIHEDLQ